MTARLPCFGLLMLVGLNAASAADALPKNFDLVLRPAYYELRRDAAAAYQKKDYDDAFAKFHRLACAGDKPSQASLAEMYLTGTGVQRNDLTAYEWFKVASEYNFPAYRKVTKTIEDQLSPTQAQFTQPRAAQLLALYGLHATNMSCNLTSSTWSASNLKDNLVCTPDAVGDGAYFMLHRCVDEEPVATPK